MLLVLKIAFSPVADLSPGMHGLLPDRQNREIIVFIMNYEIL